MPIALCVEDLRVRYPDRDHPALDGVDLEVPAGTTVALLGASGSGKSTVLRAVAGLVACEGRITVGGRDLAGVPPERRGLGLMFQDFALFPHLDVGANVAFGLRMAGRRGDPARARVAETLAMVDLRGFERRRIASLSGGEQQRVALARALAPEPAVLLLDEPLGSLDRALRDDLARDLRRLCNELGQSVLTVTHDQHEALTMAGAVVLLRRGQVVQAGNPGEVWRRPADAEVARFLGHRNVYDIDVRDGRAATPLGTIAVPGHRDGPAAVVVPLDAVEVDATGDLEGRVTEAARFVGTGFVVETAVGPWALEVRTTSADLSSGSPIRLRVDLARVVTMPSPR